MIVLATIIHFLSFCIGIGGGIAAMLTGIRANAAPTEAVPVLRGIQKTIGRLSFGALVLLWLTGIYMVYAGNGSWSGMGTAFWLKMLAVMVLTVAALTSQYFTLTASRRDPGVTGPRMAKIGMVASGAAVTALILAIIAFSG